MYVCGSPGTGKTLSVETVAGQVCQDYSVKFVMINANRCNTPATFWPALLEKFKDKGDKGGSGKEKKSAKASDAMAELQKKLLPAGKSKKQKTMK